MSATIAPVGAWCPVDETGVLQIQHLQYFRHDIMVPAGKTWRLVRVIVQPMDAYEEREEAMRAIDVLPDCVACALLGVEETT